MSTPGQDASSTAEGDPFAAPKEGWRKVSPRLADVRRVSVLVPLGVAVALATVLLAVFGAAWMTATAGTVGVLLLLWAWWLIGRQVRATAYALRRDDLIVVSGITFRRLVVVPYGRMQLVDVSRGPIDRHFGLSTVQLHTAAATSDATVPGLAPEVAADLRDQLAALGEQRGAGL